MNTKLILYSFVTLSKCKVINIFKKPTRVFLKQLGKHFWPYFLGGGNNDKAIHSAEAS